MSVKGVKISSEHRQRIKSVALLERLQEFALGNTPDWKVAIPNLFRQVCKELGVDHSTLEARKAQQVMWDGIGSLHMSMAQVRAAEVVLKKALPDLAQVETHGSTTNAHVVYLPQAQSAKEWALSAQAGADLVQQRVIEHEAEVVEAANGN